MIKSEVFASVPSGHFLIKIVVITRVLSNDLWMLGTMCNLRLLERVKITRLIYLDSLSCNSKVKRE